MNAKFKPIMNVIKELDCEIKKNKEDLDWYKLKIEQLSSRMNVLKA